MLLLSLLLLLLLLLLSLYTIIIDKKLIDSLAIPMVDVSWGGDSEFEVKITKKMASWTTAKALNEHFKVFSLF